MKILFSGGGTLGSVTPLLAVAEIARKESDNVSMLWVGTKDGPEHALIEDAGIDFISIPSGRLRRFLTWRNLFTPFHVFSGLMEAQRILRQYEPDVVVGAGGFVSVPVIWAAHMMKIPAHIHQMDWRPGLANKLCAPFAESVSVTFEKSKQDFPEEKVHVTGNPVRSFLFSGSAERARQIFDLKESLHTVLVLGGGTGALNLNRLIAESLPFFNESLQVIHATGSGKSVPAPDSGVRYRSVEFLGQDMAHAFAAADLVVTRAGMGTLTELAALGLPSVIVPIPESHQEENARFFAENGAADIFHEDDGPKRFAEQVKRLLEDAKRLTNYSVKIRELNDPAAARKIYDLIKSD